MPQGIVAIVDDDPHICQALGFWLKLNDLRASHHQSAESLLQIVRQEANHIVLSADEFKLTNNILFGAVLDFNLPGINGIELAVILRKMAPFLPITIITALNEEQLERHGELPSGIRCLKKPFDLDTLEDALFPFTL